MLCRQNFSTYSRTALLSRRQLDSYDTRTGPTCGRGLAQPAECVPYKNINMALYTAGRDRVRDPQNLKALPVNTLNRCLLVLQQGRLAPVLL